MRRLLASAIALGLLGASPLALAAGPVPEAAPRASSSPTTQLPTSVRPLEYAITVTPDAAKLRFDGHASIAIEVLAATRTVTLNAIDMSFANVRLRPANGRDQSPKAVRLEADAQQASFDFAEPLRPGLYRLEMDYTGKIGTQANGLFAIDYDTPKGRKRALFTQFENSDARRFVPSWDEPGFKTRKRAVIARQAPITEVKRSRKSMTAPSCSLSRRKITRSEDCAAVPNVTATSTRRGVITSRAT
jgi:aminopeptidase N